MKTMKSKAGRPSQPKRPPKSSTVKKRQLVKSIRKSRRLEYPLHKRMLLHPLSMFIFLCAGVFMAGWTYHVVAATIISATVEAPPLQSAATITAPDAGATFTSSPIHITGTCPSSSYVSLKTNGAFNGVSWCANDNTYDITATLHRGVNTLVVQDYNETDLAGPTSSSIQVTYVPPNAVSLARSSPSISSTAGTPTISSSQPTTTPTTTPTTSPSVTQQNSSSTAPVPLLLTSDFQFHTFAAQKTFGWDLDLEGGTPPYNVNINWGDGTTGHMRFPGDPVFTLQHTYKTDGYYAVVVNSTDTAGDQHVMQLAALITKKDGSAPFLSTATDSHGSTSNSGSKTGTATGSASKSDSDSSRVAATHLLVVAWPSYLIVTLMTVSFWLGEKREINLMVAKPRHRH